MYIYALFKTRTNIVALKITFSMLIDFHPQNLGKNPMKRNSTLKHFWFSNKGVISQYETVFTYVVWICNIHYKGNCVVN